MGRETGRMGRGGSEACIGASGGCGVAGISSSARASPGGFGMRAQHADPVQGEREVRDDGAGPHALAVAAGSERRRSSGSCVQCWPSWRWPGRPLAPSAAAGP